MSLEHAESLSSVINCDELLTRCLNNIEFAERILALFQNRCGEDLSDLERAFERGDMDSVRRLSHRLAGASANAAAFGLQSCAANVRHAASDGSLDQARQRLHELRGEWERFTSAMATAQQTLETT
ncbi:MAG: Hpt domain-containing protein [Planctomycetaceae bacterium]|nr:Hpt domain-containing protein [Planctomycetaceae bacterium]